MTKPFKILIVDDEPEICEIIDHALQPMDCQTHHCYNGQTALDWLEDHAKETIIVVSDQMMPELTGFELRKKMQSRDWNDLPFVMVSAHITKDMALQAMDLEIAAFLSKPVIADEILKTIQTKAQKRIDALEEKTILTQSFIEEAQGLIEDLEPIFLQLEETPGDPELVNNAFRIVHTIKGASGVVGEELVTNYLHAYEDLLTQVKNSGGQVDENTISVFLTGLDQVKQFIADIEQKVDINQKYKTLDYKNQFQVSRVTAKQKQAKPTSPKDQATTSPQKKLDTIGVPTEMLDQFMGLSGEITVIRNMVNKLVVSIDRRLPQNAEVQLLGELLEEMHKINSSMQNQITELRKVPISKVFRTLPRTVRDLSRSLGKDIAFQTEGDELRIDTSLSQALSNSLIHIIRNSVDHGIEDPQVRKSANKVAKGTIAVEAEQTSDDVIVHIKDDGGGIHTEKLRQKIIEKNFYTKEQLEQKTDRQIQAVIFEPGFSTAANVTDISGRGVGMDMVRTSIDGVHGKVEVDSALGEGTHIKITLPIPKSAIIIDSLLVESSQRVFVIPQDQVVRLLRFETEQQKRQIENLEGTRVLNFDDQIIPIVNLSQTLDLPASNPTCDCIVVVHNGKETYGLQVDEILDAEEIVVKTLPKTIASLNLYQGSTFMGDGTVGLVLDVLGISQKAGIAATESTQSQGDIEAVEQRPQKEFLLFNLGDRSLYGISLDEVFRLEDIDVNAIQFSHDQMVLPYRDEIMQIIDLSTKLNSAVGDQNTQPTRPVIVVRNEHGMMGLMIDEIRDIKATDHGAALNQHDHLHIAGTLIIDENTVTVIDLDSFFEPKAKPPTESSGPGWALF